ncbi:hypothetical protein PV325_011911 [Microctonus aethiopoides]|uniref:Uncharacterized protein n=1 Tax=Microctonus aethiopoides TaxID=144406 RepID=A0AA39FP30_9HYME|nr:hypothetical protein PV325_011911 [Microctonus aethiopoides]KAK0073111.1 hypothetical protein PV326_013777 [Microctonus aethiopoides]KAK0172925.1 hypothetical protein PV328_006188 [Microctonus aethiopoides]
MHAVGLHSALAIKRQRKRRDEQRRARERRFSAQSGESGLTSPRASTGSLDHHPRHHHATQQHRTAGQGMLDSKVVTSIGMLHIGVVFLVLGGFLLVSGLLPGDLANWSSKGSGGWWNELVITGLFAVMVGLFLIVLNRIIAKKEEDDLEEYVQRQLTRSRSGHRLERDVETGGLTTRHGRKAKQLKKMPSTSSIEVQNEKIISSPPRSPPPAYSPPPVVSNAEHQIIQSPLFLEQITEEEIISDKHETSTTNSLSPGSPSETRELLRNNSNHSKKLNGHHNPHHHHHQHSYHHDDHQPIYVNPAMN